MLDWERLKSILIIGIACSTITLAFIQKTKKVCKSNNCITWYSLLMNLLIGFVFSLSFSDISMWESIWVGVFSFIGADTLYQNLEGKLSSYTDLVSTKVVKKNNIEINSNDNNDIVEEIKYE